MTLSNSDLAQIKSTLNSLGDLLADHGAAEDPNQQRKTTDRIVEFLRSNPSAFTFAHSVLDQKIEDAITEFVSATRHFWNSSASARRVAESTDLVSLVRHQRNELCGESIESARTIHALFSTVSASHESTKNDNTNENKNQ